MLYVRLLGSDFRVEAASGGALTMVPVILDEARLAKLVPAADLAPWSHFLGEEVSWVWRPAWQTDGDMLVLAFVGTEPDILIEAVDGRLVVQRLAFSPGI